MSAVALKFQIGARTIAAVSRDLVRVPLSLDQVMVSEPPILPAQQGDGYFITSLPLAALNGLDRRGLAPTIRQHYVRHYVDLGIGYDHWLESLSASARSTLRRKTRKAVARGLEVREYRTAAEFAVFHPIARALSATTYQERLLGAGLPDDAAAVTHLVSLAEADRLRAWLALIDGTPAAYLCCTAQGSALRYDHVGHDPALADLSPGTVLQAEALKALFDDRFILFDFTEGEGQHKKLFASAGIPCVDLLLLRPTLGNRLTTSALTAFDALMAAAKRTSRHPRLARIASKIRR